MSAYKQFNSQDVIITPFQVNKRFPIIGNDLTASNIGIDFFQGIHYDSSSLTGLINQQYQRLVYDSVKQLYYTNYISNNDPYYWPQTSSDFIATTDTNHRFDNSISSLVSESRIFPTASNRSDNLLLNGGFTPTGMFPQGDYGWESPVYTHTFSQSFHFSPGTASMDGDGNGYMHGVITKDFIEGKTYELTYTIPETYTQGAVILANHGPGGANIYISTGPGASAVKNATVQWEQGTSNLTKLCIAGWSSGGNYNGSLSNLSVREVLDDTTDDITVISIPSKLYGDNIAPSSFAFTYGTTTIYDDGEGNLFRYSSSAYSSYGTSVYGTAVYGYDYKDKVFQVGNIIYSQGMAIITSGSLTGLANTLSSSVDNLESASISFSSSFDLYETQYKCTINENEFNYSLNPSLISGSNLTYNGSGISESKYDSSITLGFVTESYFSPYVTTIGLYNDVQELIAVGKLSQPLQVSTTTDTTILINIDK